MKLKSVHLTFTDKESRTGNTLEIRADVKDDGTWQIATETRCGYIHMRP